MIDESLDGDQATQRRRSSILDYLLEVVQLRSPTQRDFAKRTEEHLWLADIPKEPKCWTRAWGEDGDRDDDAWVEIAQRVEPPLPATPAALELWLEMPGGRPSIEKPPRLRESILAPLPDDLDPDEPPPARELLRLEDHPHLRSIHREYVEQKWKPWCERHQRWQTVHAVYTKLFAIHQAQQRLGEQYEFVMGFGLLQWKRADQDIRRHLLTIPASLVFEASRGVFRVGPPIDGADITVELDMLEISERPAGMERAAEEGLLAAENDPWSRIAVDAVLAAIAKSLHDQGDFDPERMRAIRGAGEAPVVSWAPALLLRKRSRRSMQQFFQRVRERIAKGGETTPLWDDLSEVVDPDDVEWSGSSQEDRPGEVAPYYLPLAANEEQLQILHRVSGERGVLVQGPPGTGKSHTIANLICHLLATHQRVLVTAQTPRALRVLQEKLPANIRPLCISVLGSAQEDRKALEESVHGILQREGQWNQRRADREIQDLEQRLEGLRVERAERERELREMREADSRSHEIAEGAYRGTAKQIAEAVDREREQLGWIEDPVDPKLRVPLSKEELVALVQHVSERTSAQEEEFGLWWTSRDEELPDATEFKRLVSDEVRARESVSTTPDPEVEDLLKGLKNDTVEGLAVRVRESRSEYRKLLASGAEWQQHALMYALESGPSRWNEVLERSEAHIDGLRDAARRADERRVSLPAEATEEAVLAMAQDLESHLSAGRGLGLGPFRSAVVRRTSVVWKQAEVDGRPCRDAAVLAELIEHLQVRRSVSHLAAVWTEVAPLDGSSLAAQVAEVNDRSRRLRQALNVYDAAMALQRTAHEVRPELGALSWTNPQEWDRIEAGVDRHLAERRLTAARARLGAVERLLRPSRAGQQPHPVMDRMVSALRERDVLAWAACLTEIHRLDESKAAFDAGDLAFDTLSADAPEFSRWIQREAHDEEWSDRATLFEKAWNHARARTWSQRLTEPGRVAKLSDAIRRLDGEISRATADLASRHAWGSCFKRMSQNHRRHLIAWQQAIRKLGRGTGKYAPKHRRDAQQALDKCRDAIPGWVMPLHVLYSTVDPAAEMFDVVIVDEASQCGPESLPLMFLGKRIIVVGDDKQISPESVGVNQEHVGQLIREHLGDLEHKNSFDLQSSLFDHANRRFRDRIVLREHFRCMPEIIRFSNDLCYQTTPLDPLRQYPPNRLEPVVARHVPGGLREGSRQSVLNRPEAEALVDQVVACHEDPRYDGMSFGVIALQGKAQAQHIETLLLDRMGIEGFLERGLTCGDSYSFQGDERDVMFLSMVAAPNARVGALTRAPDERRFNVAASRARDQMWLFHSVGRSDLSDMDLRSRLLEFFLDKGAPQESGLPMSKEELEREARTADRSLQMPPSPFESWFEADVCLDILRRGFRVRPQYPVGGYRIDLVVEGTEQRIAVECDGDEWHGEDRYLADVARQRKLERCGWTFWRVRGSAYYANREEAMDSLWSRLETLGIGTAGRDQSAETTMPSELPAATDPDAQEETEVPPTEAEEAHALESASADDLNARDEPRGLDVARAEDREPEAVDPRPQPKSVKTPRRGKNFSLGQQQDLWGAVEDSEAPEAHAAPDADTPSWLLPYDPWSGAGAPDPREAASARVAEVLAEIVAHEQPIMLDCLYRRYARAAGILRVGRLVRKALNKAASHALKNRRIHSLGHNPPRPMMATRIVAADLSAPIPLRDLGDRSIAEVPMMEVLSVARRIRKGVGGLETEDLARIIAANYGVKRFTAHLRSHLMSCLEHLAE